MEIQYAIIQKYHIIMKPNSNCWGRTHAHVKQRIICKLILRNSALSVFTLLHEIGHIETTKSYMRRCESEYYATKWALERCKEYGITVPEKTIRTYQDYIWRELDRGVRRGGKHLPTKDMLNIIN